MGRGVEREVGMGSGKGRKRGRWGGEGVGWEVVVG